ncbi:hypothetical protein D9Q98_000437 [Chlorella vulgaris]|uniref:CHRD domain-containing protein n=1 Tax=Chlorella vulgaris TaxID=3077 RepID=A0A9D4Z1K0_CHLVU|nr:hypothetical protein D9Q98_000437 [Chlorella vulgaris]
MKAAALIGLLALGLLPHAFANEGSAVLDGSSQVPIGVNTTMTGYWNATASPDGTGVDWTLEVFDAIDVTMAHIHQGGPEDNGPVIVFLVPVGVGSAATTNTLPQLSPPASGADLVYQGRFTAADMGGPAAGNSLEQLYQLFESDGAYVNVHTSAYPNGEIRGQVEWQA